ncbi:hypothetical protein BDN70DRAFT_920949 [Pholiota conissans]|uniref:Uncharacterized protein n=1 Tax=Pholiota conissans TaxID=109636 RepID=A0A9P5Z5N1_9AGAR|nr:hypothetical protein BDN70DRAFT_920949 [Pholiota conissans]
MALSVSGFPEPSRQPGGANSMEGPSTAESGQEGSGKSTMVSSPRLRGLFGGGGNGVSSGKKSVSPAEAKPASTSSTSSKADENDGSQAASSSPSSSALTFSPSFEPLSQQKYDFDTPSPFMFDSERAQAASKRVQRTPPLPKRAKASPVRLAPSLTRLDIGAVGWSRLPMASHFPSKPPPPSVVIEEWPQNDTVPTPSSTTSQTRPLPTLPTLKTESNNSALNSSLSGLSRRVNTVSASMQQQNAIAGPSQYPGALSNTLSPTTSSLSALTSPALTPPSKILIMQPIPQRTTKHSLTMRYQPLVATSAASSALPSGDASSSSDQSASPIRPLPRIPPTTSISLGDDSNAVSSLSSDLSEENIKRPKTSPGIVAGFSSSPRASVTALPRTVFTNPSSSPSRQWDVIHNSNPLPIGSPLKTSRARSHSHLSRRDRSLDSYYSTPRTSPAPSRVPSPIGGRPSLSGSRSRSVRHAATIDYLPQTRGSPTIPSAPFASSMALQIHIADPVTVGKRTQPPPPSPPVGPVKPRLKPPASGSPTTARIVTAQPSAPSTSSTSNKPLVTTPAAITAATSTIAMNSPNPVSPTTVPFSDDTDDMYSIDAPLHSHPIDTLTDTESVVNPPLTPVEVYIDDQDCSTMSRSPSPIRYARPDSRGHLSSSDGDNGGLPSSSSSESDRSVSPGPARRRTQLRSYRNSYRPREGTSPPHIPYRRSPSPIGEQHQQQQQLQVPSTGVADTEKKEKPKKKATRSYFSEYIATSAPSTRASSPERKSRSRQPRRLANAVSLALRNTSPSPKRNSKGKAQPTLIDDGEVLDIGPAPPAPADPVESESSSITETVPQTSSARSSAKVGWVKSMARKRSEVFNFTASASAASNSSISHLSNAGTAPVELDGAEKPYMWISTSKPPVAPAPFIPIPPPRQQHRRVDSADFPASHAHAHSTSNSYTEREREKDIERESERYNLVCGLPLSTGPISNSSSKPRSSDPTASGQSGHTSSSSISIPSSSFSGFGIAARTRKLSKHVSSASVSLQMYGQSSAQTTQPTPDIRRQDN